MTYVEDDNGATVTEACMYHCAPGVPAACDAPACECDCHTEPEFDWHGGERREPPPDVVDRLEAEHYARARELDDRPADKLAVIAADMEREQYGNVRDLTAERFGRPTRGAA